MQKVTAFMAACIHTDLYLSEESAPCVLLYLFRISWYLSSVHIR